MLKSFASIFFYIAWKNTKWMVSTSFDPYNNTETITRETICNLEPVRLWAAIESELSFEKAKKLCDDLDGEFPVIEGPNKTDVMKIFSKFHAGIHCFIFCTDTELK